MKKLLRYAEVVRLLQRLVGLQPAATWKPGEIELVKWSGTRARSHESRHAHADVGMAHDGVFAEGECRRCAAMGRDWRRGPWAGNAQRSE